jgi:hypothetical protein
MKYYAPIAGAGLLQLILHSEENIFYVFQGSVLYQEINIRQSAQCSAVLCAYMELKKAIPSRGAIRICS